MPGLECLAWVTLVIVSGLFSMAAFDVMLMLDSAVVYYRFLKTELLLMYFFCPVLSTFSRKKSN